MALMKNFTHEVTGQKISSTIIDNTEWNTGHLLLEICQKDSF